MTSHSKKSRVFGSRSILIVAVVVSSFLAAFLGQVLITGLSISPSLLPEPGIIVRSTGDVHDRLYRAAQSFLLDQRSSFVRVYEAGKPAMSVPAYVVSSDGWIVYAQENDAIGFTPDRVRFDSGETVPISMSRDDSSSALRFVKVDRERLDAVNISQGEMPNALTPLLSLSTDGLISLTYNTGVTHVANMALSSDVLNRLPYVLTSSLVGPAIFNEKGELVAIAAVSAKTEGALQSVVAAPVLRKAISSLLKSGSVERPTIGITYTDLAHATLVTSTASELRSGALVLAPVLGKPAQAGLRMNDIITAVDGTPLSERFGLSDAVVESKPGQKLELTVRRNGQNLTVVLEVQKAGE